MPDYPQNKDCSIWSSGYRAMKPILFLFVVSIGMFALVPQSHAQSLYEPCQNSACALDHTPCVYECQKPELTFKFGVPLWLPEQHGTVTVRGQSAPVHITTRDDFKLLSSDIDMLFAGRLDVKYGSWGAFADGIYYNVAVSENILPRINLTSGFSQAIVDFAVTYDINSLINGSAITQDWEALVLLGGRYNLLDVNQITLTGSRGRSVTRSGERDWVDPIIGGQVRAPLTEDLWLSFRGDVGGFGIGSASHFTWNIEALAEFQCSDCFQLMMGYRLLDIDQRQGSGNNRFVYDMQIKGPITRLVFSF